eukprot:6480117-Prymnesium_polylepis.2
MGGGAEKSRWPWPRPRPRPRPSGANGLACAHPTQERERAVAGGRWCVGKCWHRSGRGAPSPHRSERARPSLGRPGHRHKYGSAGRNVHRDWHENNHPAGIRTHAVVRPATAATDTAKGRIQL